jgi:hypothetical protein
MTSPTISEVQVQDVWANVHRHELRSKDGLTDEEKQIYQEIITDISTVDEDLGEDTNGISEISRNEFETAFLGDTIIQDGVEISRESNAAFFLGEKPIWTQAGGRQGQECIGYWYKYTKWCEVGDIVKRLLDYRNELGMDVEFEEGVIEIRNHGTARSQQHVADPVPGTDRVTDADVLQVDDTTGEEEVISDEYGNRIVTNDLGAAIDTDYGVHPERGWLPSSSGVGKSNFLSLLRESAAQTPNVGD